MVGDRSERLPERIDRSDHLARGSAFAQARTRPIKFKSELWAGARRLGGMRYGGLPGSRPRNDSGGRCRFGDRHAIENTVIVAVRQGAKRRGTVAGKGRAVHKC